MRHQLLIALAQVIDPGVHITRFYLNIPIEIRNHNNLLGNNKCEKNFIRKSIEL